MTAPAFSIITPTFRRPLLLKRNILSVKNQTFENYEHIIIDDANDQETALIVNEFADERTVFLQNLTNKGAAGSYNTGIKTSRGQFILFLDDDDEYLPCFLKKVHDFFLHSSQNIGFIWTGISRIKDTVSGEKLLFSLIWPSRFSTKGEGWVAATSIGNGFGVCVRKDCFETIGIFDESLTVGEDTDLLFRLAQNFDFETIPEVLVKIHQHGTKQLTSDNNYLSRVEGKEIVLNRYHDFIAQSPELYFAHYKAYAELCYKSGFKKKGRKVMLSIIRKTPFKILNFTDLLSYEVTGKDTLNTYCGINLKRIVRSLKRNGELSN